MKEHSPFAVINSKMKILFFKCVFDMQSENQMDSYVVWCVSLRI